MRSRVDALGQDDFCYLTTIGRKSGLERTIEIWFALRGSSLYMLSGGLDHSDWVKNIQVEPRVRVSIRDFSVAGRARTVAPNTDEDSLARRLLAGKYQGWREGKRMSGWARTSLPVVVELELPRAKTA